MSDETRAKISATTKGVPKSAEFGAKVSATLKGRTPSDADRKAVGEANARRVWSDASLKKLSVASTGRHSSEETRAKLSAALKGNKYGVGKRTEETRARMSAARLGRRFLRKARGDSSLDAIPVRKPFVKVCCKCKREFLPTGKSQKWCADCEPGERVKYSAAYYAGHKEQQVTWVHAYKLKHPEEYRQRMKRHQAKRRALGFVPLNEPFDGADAHHVSREYVVYIPEDLHCSVSHNIWTGKNMEQINLLAFDYLVRQLEVSA